jgi:ketosteroid isomerase-like protein
MAKAILMTVALTMAAMVSAHAADAPPPEQVLAEARAKVAAAAALSRAAAKTPEEKAVVEADLAFAADAKKRGPEEAFAAAIHPDGKMFPPRQPIVVGVEATRAAFKGDKSLWEWAPVQVVANGDLGATWGVAAISGTGEDGKPFVVTTRYVSVWRKDADGKWKMWLDVGTPGPLPEVK